MYTGQKWCKLWVIVTIVLFHFSVYSQTNAIKTEHVSNLYQVSDQLYRSAQPDKLALDELEAIGVSTILNLRNFKGNRGYKGAKTIALKRHRINSWLMNYKDILKSFQLFLAAEKPVLVHCKHGADRTGVFVAVYRILIDNWTKSEAIDELRNGGFGFHEKYFTYMIKLIEDLDVTRLRSDLKL